MIRIKFESNYGGDCSDIIKPGDEIAIGAGKLCWQIVDIEEPYVWAVRTDFESDETKIHISQISKVERNGHIVYDETFDFESPTDKKTKIKELEDEIEEYSNMLDADNELGCGFGDYSDQYETLYRMYDELARLYGYNDWEEYQNSFGDEIFDEDDEELFY